MATRPPKAAHSDDFHLSLDKAVFSSPCAVEMATHPPNTAYSDDFYLGFTKAILTHVKSNITFINLT